MTLLISSRWEISHPALLSFCPQLLNSQSTNKMPQHSNLGPYFQDGQRRIDYILTYHVDKLEHTRHHSSSTFKGLKDSLCCTGKRNKANSSHHDPESASNAHIHREEFEHKLSDMGLELEKEEDVSMHDDGRTCSFLNITGLLWKCWTLIGLNMSIYVL